MTSTTPGLFSTIVQVETEASTTSTIKLTNIGPLTTTFSPPNDCLTVVDLAGLYDGGIGQRCWVNTGQMYRTHHTAVPSCFPGAFASAVSIFYTMPPVYSPGLVCPLGYTTACSIVHREGFPKPSSGTGKYEQANVDLWKVLKEDEVAVGCCPSGFGCDTSSPLYCFMTTGPIARTTGFAVAPECGATTTIGGVSTVSARRLQLIQPYNETTHPLDNNDESSGLSTAGKITIGVVVPLAVLLIVPVIVWFIRRKKRLKKNTQARKIQAITDGGGEVATKPELYGSEGVILSGSHSVAFEKSELDNAPVDGGPHTTALELDVGPLDKGLLELHGNIHRGKKPSTVFELASVVTSSRAELQGDQLRDGVSDETLCDKQQQTSMRPLQEPEDRTTGLWQWSHPLQTKDSGEAVSAQNDPERS